MSPAASQLCYSSLHYLFLSKCETNGTEKRWECRTKPGDLSLYQTAALPSPGCGDGRLLGSKVGQVLPPHKADAALLWEFVSDTDQTHFI